MESKNLEIIPEHRILKSILVIRGEKVILDSDLAELYGVETRRLNEQVRRNIDKFPEDFMFQLALDEFQDLKSQIATSSSGWGGRRKPPLVYTEHGALQAANFLNSSQANKMSVYIIRAFVHLREFALTNEKLANKVNKLEDRVSKHDEVLTALIREIRQLIEAPKPKKRKRRIGFIPPK
jgi:ORF6N domain-containing protein